MIVYLFLLCLLSLAKGSFGGDVFEITQTMLDNGLVITQAGEWNLAESVKIYGSNSIKVQSDNVVINLRGYVIQGSDDALQGIEIQQSHCVIKNGTLSGFSSAALYVNNALSVRVEDLFIHDSMYGIQVVGSSDVDLEKVSIKICKSGLFIEDSHYISVQHCYIEDIDDLGIWVHGQSDGVLVHMVQIKNGGSAGIRIDSDGVQLIRVWAQYGKADGIVIHGNGVSCENVTSAYNAGSGFVLGGMSNFLRVCTGHSNKGDGVSFTTSAQNNTVILGIYALNSLIGINNNGALTNKVVSAKVYDNGQRNIYHIQNNLVT